MLLSFESEFELQWFYLMMAVEQEELNPTIKHPFCNRFSNCGGYIP